MVNSPAKDGGKAGDYTREAGFLSYYEVCQMLLSGANYIWDKEMKVPYLVKGDQWVRRRKRNSVELKIRFSQFIVFKRCCVWLGI